MQENRLGAVVIKHFVLFIGLGMAHQVMAQHAQTHYPKMAPIDQYLMADREAEIALARSAAPESIAREAEVQVLGRLGFETAGKGKNGFVCIVGRSWTSAADEDYWDPKVRVRECGSCTFLPPAHQQNHQLGPGGTYASSGERGHRSRHRQKRAAADGIWSDVLHDVEARIRWGQPPTLAFAPHVFLFKHRSSSMGSEFAGFTHHCRGRPPGASDFVRDYRTILV